MRPCELGDRCESRPRTSARAQSADPAHFAFRSNGMRRAVRDAMTTYLRVFGVCLFLTTACGGSGGVTGSPGDETTAAPAGLLGNWTQTAHESWGTFRIWLTFADDGSFRVRYEADPIEADAPPSTEDCAGRYVAASGLLTIERACPDHNCAAYSETQHVEVLGNTLRLTTLSGNSASLFERTTVSPAPIVQCAVP